ncbi:Tetratricopeptide-like helical [Penicillium chrysogenum]|nr:Tetratricopeptide-like helical [Penicillium chrysogenum]
MEDIALFVLPNTNEEENFGDLEASVGVAKLESKGKTSGTESEANNLGYSAAGDYRQISTDFSKLLTSEEVGYTSKFLAWRTIDDDLESAPVKQMMETRKTKLGADHPNALTSMTNLGRITTRADGKRPMPCTGGRYKPKQREGAWVRTSRHAHQRRQPCFSP